jgi:hypothetical protein
MRSRDLSSSGAALLAAVVFSGCGSSPQVVRPTIVDAPAPVHSSGAFVVRLGQDTLAVERFTRTATRLEGEIVNRTPSVRVGRYSVEIGPDGLPTSATYTVRTPEGQPVQGSARSVRLEFGADSVTVTAEGDSTVMRRRPLARGFPVIANSFAMYELYLSQLLASGADSLNLMVMPFVTGANPVAYPIVRRGPREAAVYYFGSPQLVRLGDGGRVEAIDARNTTFGVVVERVGTVDIPAIARAFAASSRLVLSPRDTVRAAIGGANLLVDYSRPAKRGREVFGGALVPWNTVWRLGANTATHFRTDRDLTIGNLAVPAGTYTMFLLPAPDRWQLIINRQTGQWGTEYDRAQDLGRVDLAVSNTPSPVEQLTIEIVPQGGGGALRISWDDRSAMVPITVR